ncbi:hypothetical protein H206_03514 [Candidatus Electrothrix aarhusensis]|uniref:Uncharacterized protein n=1 Tax=Candidatus Electrothrix aarhusensis TaxID=1859131 RepID=A0A3S3UCC6_9BACT|nr:hypothetical protein H206_03514 [Candidatus Electrothrix aarhusensis]
MSSLFHPSLLSNRFGQSFELPSPSIPRTKEAGQAKSSPAVRGNVQMFFALLPDLTLIYFILALDAVLTAKIFLRAIVGAKKSTAAG